MRKMLGDLRRSGVRFLLQESQPSSLSTSDAMVPQASFARLAVSGLHEHPDDRLGAGRADEHAARIAELGVDALDRLSDRLGELLRGDTDVLLALDEARQDRCGLAQRAPSRAAQSSSAAARPSPVTWSCR